MPLPEADPFTAALRAFFASQVGPSIANAGVSLNFSPLEPPLSSSNFQSSENKYDQVLADIYFSINIADRPAHVVGDQHFVNMNTSLSALIDGTVLDQATFYARVDLNEKANEINLKIFEKMLSKARDGMVPSVAPAATPFKYMQSFADPAKWGDAQVDDIWKEYTRTFVSKKPVAGQAGDGVTYTPAFRLPWRVFDIEELKKLVTKLRKGFQGPLPYPPVPINELDDVPTWVKHLPKPIPAQQIGDFGARFLENKERGMLGASGMEPTPLSLEALEKSNVDLGQIGTVQTNVAKGLHATKPGQGFATITGPKQFGGVEKLQGGGGFGGGGGAERQMMMGGEPGEDLFPAPVAAVRLEDFAVNEESERMASWVFQSAALKNAARVQPTEVKDEVTVSFEYAIVRIHRPWMDTVMPLLASTNWYIPGARKGELTQGKESGANALLEVIPQSVLIVRNLRIAANFTDADREAIGKAFALGPFTLDSHVDVQSGSLSWSGMQIVGYVDVALPPVPPRSDPSFAV